MTIGSFLVEALAQETPYPTILATDKRAASKLVHHVTPDLCMLDDGVPNMKGIERYDRLHNNTALAAVAAILMTASCHVPQQQIQQRQPIAFKKPFELDAFLLRASNKTPIFKVIQKPVRRI